RDAWADVTGGGVRGLLAGQDEIVPADLLDRLAQGVGRRDRIGTAEDAVRQEDRPVRAHRHRPLEALVEGGRAHGEDDDLGRSMERTTTSAACRSFRVRAISRAFASGGLISLGTPTRLRVWVTGS